MDTERRYTTAVPGERPTSQAQLVPDVDNALFFVSHGYLHYSGDVCESIDVEAHAAQVTGGYIYNNQNPPPCLHIIFCPDFCVAP